MSTSLRLPLGALLLAAAAACSGAPDKPALSADLEQDLARAGGAKVELAGSPANRGDVVSATERWDGVTPAPKGRETKRVASKEKGNKAIAPSKRGVTPVDAASRHPTNVAPVEQPTTETDPTTVREPQGRPDAPIPAPQREPPGGWRTPSDVIRNAPFPINP
jgi:hypothetical protein